MLEALAVGTAVITTPCPGGAVELARSTPGCVVARATTANALALIMQTAGGYLRLEGVGKLDLHGDLRGVPPDNQDVRIAPTRVVGGRQILRHLG